MLQKALVVAKDVVASVWAGSSAQVASGVWHQVCQPAFKLCKNGRGCYDFGHRLLFFPLFIPSMTSSMLVHSSCDTTSSLHHHDIISFSIFPSPSIPYNSCTRMMSSYIMWHQSASLVCPWQTSMYYYISHIYLACNSRLDFLCNTNTISPLKAPHRLVDFHI